MIKFKFLLLLYKAIGQQSLGVRNCRWSYHKHKNGVCMFARDLWIGDLGRHPCTRFNRAKRVQRVHMERPCQGKNCLRTMHQRRVVFSENVDHHVEASEMEGNSRFFKSSTTGMS